VSVDGNKVVGVPRTIIEMWGSSPLGRIVNI